MRINQNPDMDLWTKAIGALSTGIKHRSGYSKNMHALEVDLSPDFTRDELEKVAAFVQVASMSGFVCIIKGNPQVPKDLGADGVIISDIADIDAARTIVGEKAILGLECTHDISSLDKTLLDTVDYITLGEASKLPALDLLARVMMLKLDLVFAALGPINQDNCIAYAAAGTSFIDCTHYMLTHPKGHMQGVVNLLHEINTASSIKHI